MDIAFQIKMINELRDSFVMQSLKDAVSEHEIINTKKTKEELTMTCMTFLIKERIKADGVAKLIEDCKNIGGLHNLFSNNKN